MYIKTNEGNYFEVVKTEEYGSGYDLMIWKIRSTIYDDNLFYYDLNLGMVKVDDIEYEMEEEEYVTELAKWLLRNAQLNGARDRFLEWGKAHGWSFMIKDGRAIFGTNGQEIVMVGGGPEV